MSDSAQSIGAAYDARAEEYTALLGSAELLPPADRALIERWRDTTVGGLVDAGCGPGHWTALLAGEGREVLGIDASEAFVHHASRRFPHVTFAHGNLEHLPVGVGSLGGILAWYSLIHTPPDAVPALLRGWARALAPGASLLLGYFEGPRLEPFDHAVTRAYYWPREELAAALSAAGFSSGEHHEREDEGSRRHGDLTAVRRLDRARPRAHPPSPFASGSPVRMPPW